MDVVEALHVALHEGDPCREPTIGTICPSLKRARRCAPLLLRNFQDQLDEDRRATLRLHIWGKHAHFAEPRTTLKELERMHDVMHRSHLDPHPFNDITYIQEREY